MAATLCQFVGEDGPAHPQFWLPGSPRDVVLTPVKEEVCFAYDEPCTRFDMQIDQWRLKTVMPLRDETFLALYQFDRRTR